MHKNRFCPRPTGQEWTGRRKGGETMWRILEFWQEEDAVGVVEIILILVVLIGLVIIFKEQLVSLVNGILEKITSQSNSI